MRARSITRDARFSIPQSHATAILPAAPSPRGTSFHPVPLQSVQFSSAIGSAGFQPALLPLSDSIRSRTSHGKQSAMGKLWKELLTIFSETDLPSNDH